MLNGGVFKRVIKLVTISLIIMCLIYLQKQTDFIFWKLLLAALMGFVMAGMINLAHECLHQKFTSSRFSNQWIGRLSTMLLLINFTIFKWHHLVHHQYVGTDKDTESNGDFKSVIEYLFALTGLKLAKKKIKSSFIVLLKYYPSYVHSLKGRADAYTESVLLVFFLVVIITLTFYQFSLLLFSYWIPLLLSYSGIMFFAIPEHNGCKTVDGYYSSARSITTNCLVRFIMWHGNYHAEHHIFPAVCSDALEKIDLKDNNRIYYREKSYLKWHCKLFYSLLLKKSTSGDQVCQK